MSSHRDLINPWIFKVQVGTLNYFFPKFVEFENHHMTILKLVTILTYYKGSRSMPPNILGKTKLQGFFYQKKIKNAKPIIN
jgi:hypothetical protein